MAAGRSKKRKQQERNPNAKGPVSMPKSIPFKKSRTESLAPAEAAATLLIQDDDPDFPRGGRSMPMAVREEEGDAQFDEAEYKGESGERDRKWRDGRKQKRNKQSSTAGGEKDDIGSLFGEGITGKLPKFANRITLKNISPNMKLWGVIVEVNSKDLVIGLPCGLRGFVRAEEVGDLTTDSHSKGNESTIPCSVFHVGQLVSCVVLQVDEDKKESKGNKRIWLSLRLSLLHKSLNIDAVQEGMVITAQIKSIEDHGCILHLGSTFTGFLPMTNKVHGEARAGQLLQGVVKSVDKARGVVYIDSDANLVSRCVINDLKGLSMEQLVPGMMVKARVHAILDNGIMLSFLTYFTGTVDIFNLQNCFPPATWKDDYAPNKKVTARILFIDPSTRAIGLTFNTDLIHNNAPQLHVKAGDIYDEAVVIRVDRGAGILLRVPSAPSPSPAFVNVHEACDDETMKLERKFKVGTHVRVRILGYRHLEGLAIGTLKASAFEGSVFTHSDVKSGMLVRAKVIAVDSFGAIVQLSSGVKALCPLPHMSEFEIAKPTKKFKVGAELLFRVLGCKSKRITVTHKKTLVKSKLDVLSSYAGATEGLVVHGWITKIEKHGCFIRFYNGVQGFAHRTELGLDLGSDASAMFHVGQVVKCRVVSSVPSAHKISLSFVLSSKSGRETKEIGVKEGNLVSGVVEQLTPTAVVVHLNRHGYLKGSISNEHLADHQGHAILLKSLLKPGYEFDKLLVLDAEGKTLLLSAKYSLVNSAQDIPSDVALVRPSSVIHGYVCNLIDTGCFVRFLGHLTGFAPKNRATDEKVNDLSDAFYLGQSVRSHVLSANGQTGRIKLSLEQSICFSTDASLIRGYFISEEKIASLLSTDMKIAKSWKDDFTVGNVVKGRIQEVKEFGVVVNFKDHDHLVGFITQHQLGGHHVEVGSAVKALVLDIATSDNLIDLSLRSELVEANNRIHTTKKKRLRVESMDLKLKQTVKAIVEIVKESYLVLSLPDYNCTIGYASIFDYNTKKLPLKQFVPGQSVLATVAALASPETFGRLLLLLNSLSEFSRSASKRAKIEAGNKVGTVVEGEVTEIKPLEIILKLGIRDYGRVYITEVFDDNHRMENPFNNFRVGQSMKARVLAKAHHYGMEGNGYHWELSLKPSLLAGMVVASHLPIDEDVSFAPGDNVTAYVVKVDPEWVWLTVSRHIRAQLYILDSSSEPSELENFQKLYNVGQPVKGSVLSINKAKKLLRLKLSPCSSALDAYSDMKKNALEEPQNVGVSEHIVNGALIGGRIKKINPGVGGMLVQIGPHLHGKVHYTEVVDMWVTEPLSNYHEGQYVKCRVLEVSRSPEGSLHVDLSLRASLCENKATSSNDLSSRCKKVEDLHANMNVQGYVKNVNAKGCFIILSRTIDARILLSNLSNGFVENPQQEFPVGKLVHGKILSVDPSSGRVDVTLKTDDAKQLSDAKLENFSNLRVGDVISGHIRRTESFGLFIKIDNSNLVGLCHISELSDEPVDDIQSRYIAGGKVLAKILKIDEERERISLGMKESYVGVSGDDLHGSVEDADNDPDTEHALSIVLDNVERDNTAPSIFQQADLRAFVPPLEVSLDDLENSESPDDFPVQQENDARDSGTVKKSKRLKKQEKEEREREISASEQRNLQISEPKTADEYERLVRSSPNSSFVWLQYMAFMLSIADAEKAREIAERALRTINIREEGEKLNIWVAYMNLENEYGNPPEEAVKKIFQRALQFCDPKTLHLALLGIYERTGQLKLADELLERMAKKFKSSCKVWLSHVRLFLKQGKEGVQSTINRALLSLPSKKHIKFISQAAILEFNHGVPERGRSLFEGILRQYPKRTDLWSIYLDQEIKKKDVEVIRSLFERATSLSLPLKKIKFLLKKYLLFEKSIGDDDRVNYVKQKAMELAERELA